MATTKKKVSKDSEKKGFQYSKELQGLILVLVGIIGLGNFGLVGDIIKKFCIFLFGNWYVILLVLALISGVYLISKRKKPNFFTARLIGVYTIIIALLLFSHISYLNDNEIKGIEIFRETLNRIMAANDSFTEIRHTGGGMVGAIFSYVFVTLFDVEGTNIVVIVLAGFGLIMLFDITISETFSFLIKPFKKLFTKKEKSIDVDEIIDESSEEEEEEDNRVIITSPVTSVSEEVSGERPIMKKEGEYTLPSIELLDKPKKISKVNSNQLITSNSKTLERLLNDFGILGKVKEINEGPTVTQYQVELERGTKVNKVLSIQRELALGLAAKDVRVQAPIPGKNAIGVEVPNPIATGVVIREVVEEINKKRPNSKLCVPLGKDIMGGAQYFEIDKTPHILVAGSTGSGKSVCINNIITTLIIRQRPDEVKLVLVDPKKVELNVYDGIPHLLMPVVTEPKKASVALQKMCVEMDTRYELFRTTQTKNITTYNEYIRKKLKKDPNCGEKIMPFIVVIIDELADLMLVAAKEVEDSIIRITQLARAAGIHLIVATQRPSTDVITGLIKANIPTRLSFAVASGIDSRTILDMTGAEKLLGKGDMLFLPMGENAPLRIQGSYVSDDEIKRVVDFIKDTGVDPEYDEVLSDLDSSVSSLGKASAEMDSLYNEILSFAANNKTISTSLIQRKFNIGYNRAARIMDQFEENGVVGKSNGSSKPREVLVKFEE